MKLRETFKYNRPAGIAALILVILVTVFADANLALLRTRREVKKAYKAAAFETSVEKCADEMTWLCESAASLGIHTERAEKTADALTDAAASPIGMHDTINAVYSSAVSLRGEMDALHTADNDAAYQSALRHYHELGRILSGLSADADYNAASQTYNANTERPLCRLIAPWFDETADFAQLGERYRTSFELPDEPDKPGVIDSIFGWLPNVIASIWTWVRDHIVIAVVVIVVVLVSLTGKRKR